MKTISKLSLTQIEVKKSKFISYLVPYSDFQSTLAQAKTEHPKARHFVYAYRFLNEHKQIVENQSDDGEPKGSSGKPTLAVLAGQKLVNVGVITVRYFGGTKLGVGGLVRAYSESVNEGVAHAEIMDFQLFKTITIKLTYNYLKKFEHDLTSWQHKIEEKIFHAESVELKIGFPEDQVSRFVSEFRKLKNIEILG